MGENDDRNPQGGFALVIVLFFLLLVSAISSPFILAARSSFLVKHNAILENLERLRLNNILEVGGAVQALALSANVKWPSEILTCRVTLENQADISFKYLNHAGLIDLNAASEDLISVGFFSFGLGLDEADLLAKNVVEFRSVQTTKDLLRAGSFTQLEGGLKNHPFEHIAELYEFEGLRKISLIDLAQVFTVHSRNGTLDISYATPPLLDVVQVPSFGVERHLIESGQRHPAFTLFVSVIDSDGRQLSAFRHLFADDVTANHFFLGSTIYNFDQSTMRSELSNEEACSTYFPKTTVAILQEFMG